MLREIRINTRGTGAPYLLEEGQHASVVDSNAADREIADKKDLGEQLVRAL